MKNAFKILSLSLVLIIASNLFTGCKILNPTTGQKEFSQVQTDALKAAVQGPVTTSLTIVLVNNTNDKNLETYVRSLGGVFCQIKTDKNFDPTYVANQIANLELPKISDSNTRIIVTSVKDSLIALYKVFYAQNVNVKADPEGYLYNISDILCQSVDIALKNAGKPGVN